MRTSQDFITSAFSNTNHKITYPTLAAKEFINFCINFKGAPEPLHPCPDPVVIKKGACLNPVQKLELSAEISKAEILDAVKNMPLDKAPRVDGFPTEFFTKYWDVVKDDAYKAISRFFKICMLEIV